MRTYSFALLAIVLICASCTEKSTLKEALDCNVTVTYNNLEKVDDFKNKFSLQLPKNWSTKLFYNNYETNIMSADSLKSLTKTFIMDVSLISGNLKVDDDFVDKIKKENLEEKKMEVINYQEDNFKGQPSIWFISKGKVGKFDYHYFQLFVKRTGEDYFEMITKLYGDEDVYDRICQSYQLMEKIEF